MTVTQPTIWVLKSFRAGDNAQALALAQRVGGTIFEKQMSFTGAGALPNITTGVSIRTLTMEAGALLQPPWPDLVIATGRRTAPAAVWIKQQSGGVTKIVQLGRPRLPLTLFDLVVTTPQYGLPPGPNVLQLPLPFVPARRAASIAIQDQWLHLPSPRIAAVIGGQKFPLRLGPAELSGFGAAVERLAHSLKAGVILLDSPRSPQGGLSMVASQVLQPKWQPVAETSSAYGAALAGADVFCVTSDSVSMVAEMVDTGRPVYIYQLPQSPWMPHWSADSGIAAWLARRGLLSPPRDTAGLMKGLIESGLTGDLATRRAPFAQMQLAAQYDAAVLKVRSLLRR